MCKWLALIWNDNTSFFQQRLLMNRGIQYAYHLGKLKPRNHLHSCNLSHVKYFWMSENLILPPLLFSNVFPGYRGLQYLLYFFVFPVITLFFTCKKSKFSHPGLQINSHANFTQSYPQLKIILIPIVIWSILFSFITLIVCTGSLIPEILLLCDIDLLHIFPSSWNFINKAYCCF